MDRSHHTLSALDELGQIQYEVRLSRSLGDLRRYFDRVQKIRRTYVDDFDVQLLAADVQEAVIERARVLREQSAAVYLEDGEPTDEPPRVPSRRTHAQEAAEIPPEVPRMDRKSWQRAIYLALLFTILICAAFFYLIQTARRINLPDSSNTASNAAQPEAKAGTNTTSAATPAPPPKSTLRLYTDLVPGTVSIDNGAPQDLKDGELALDNLAAGRHTIKVAGRSGSAVFSFDMADNSAPKVSGAPDASNAMAVLVSEQNGKGRIYTNAEHSALLLDGKAAGDIGPDGLALDTLGTADHDLEVVRDRDRQRFVLTYTPAPALTAYVKSDPNTGTVVIMAGRDGASVFINDKLYRRTTTQGQLRIPLKAGDYTIRVHKDGFVDPPPQTAEVKKAEDTAMEFSLEPVPQFGVLRVRGAAPGTGVYIDKQFAATAGADGNADVTDVKTGEHTVELRRSGAVPRALARNFTPASPIVLSGPDVQLEKVETEVAKPSLPSPETAPPPSEPAPKSIQVPGEQIRKGGGFVHYATPKIAGHYTFRAHAHLGGFLKHDKLQWYAGYHDSDDYVLFTIDGKHAIVRRIQDGKSKEITRVPFGADSGEWIQVEMSVKAASVSARVKGTDGLWTDLGAVSSPGRDFTQDKVGFYIPGNDEIAVSNFRFTGH